VPTLVHTDHVVAAHVADLSAGPAGGDAILIVAAQLSIVLMHGDSFAVKDCSVENKTQWGDYPFNKDNTPEVQQI
jgi:hypothetical protein